MDEPGSSPSSRRKHILYRGFHYDVTDFIPRHPGGGRETIIGFYVNNREDAPEAIDQFHFRSKERVAAILKSFPRRKVTEEELISAFGEDEEKYEKNRALTKDFSNLFQELKEEGLFEPSRSHIFLRLMELNVYAVLSLYLFCYGGHKLLGAALMALGTQRCAYFWHETGHFSFTGKPWLDRLLQGGICGFYMGMSGASWRDRHNQHHAMPQHIHNADMHTLPIMAFHEKVVKNRRQFGFLVKYQKWLMYLIQPSIVGFYWKFVEHPIYCLKNGEYFDLFWMMLHNALFIPLLGPQWYFPLACVPFTNFFINATLNHSHLPITEGTTHWVEYCLVHTANVTPSLWMDYYVGYLNYQIEHHLFPTMQNKKIRVPMA